VSPVTPNLFQVLGVNAFLGRSFAPNETEAVILSSQYWRSHFLSDPKILGKAHQGIEPHARAGDLQQCRCVVHIQFCEHILSVRFYRVLADEKFVRNILACQSERDEL